MDASRRESAAEGTGRPTPVSSPPRAIRVGLRGAVAGDFVVTRTQPLTLGRAARARVLDLAASRVHCRVELREEGPFLVDLCSTNGTLLNGLPAREARLNDGDEIRIGTTRIACVLLPLREAESVCDRCGEVFEAGGEGAAERRPCPRCASGDAASRSRLYRDARAALEEAGFQGVELHPAGLGSWFDARRGVLEQPVTVEVLSTDDATKAEIEAFLRGARLAARLDHPVIPRVVEVESAGALVYAAMERLSGPTLAHRVRRHGPLVPHRAVATLLPLAKAVAYLHEVGCAHQGLRPETVVLGAEGAVKLLGIGRRTGVDPAAATVEDQLADVRALGETLAFALLGRVCDPDRLAGMLEAAGVPAVLRSVVTGACREPGEPGALLSGAAFLRALREAARELLRVGEAAELALDVLLSGGDADLAADDTRRTRDEAGLASASATFFGRFSGMELIELAQMIELHRKSGLLVVEGPDGVRGEAHLVSGRAIRARQRRFRGESALRALLSRRRGRFRFVVYEPQVVPEHDLPLGPVLLEVLRRRDETSRTQAVRPVA